MLNNNNECSVDRWIDRRITISGEGGTIYVDRDVAKTDYLRETVFVVERAPPAFLSGAQQQQQKHQNKRVAFRVEGTTNKYLTVTMYGDEIRQAIAEALLSTSGANLLPEHVSDIVDYAVDKSTMDTNFEGSGFNYSPMTVQSSGSNNVPNCLQVFQLIRPATSSRKRGNRFGVETTFGTYWRSQHWHHNKIVSQSSHLLGDETWTFRSIGRAPPTPWKGTDSVTGSEYIRGRNGAGGSGGWWKRWFA